MEVCPFCGSGENTENEGLVLCDNCSMSWNPKFKWISKIMASMFHNVAWDLERKLTEKQQWHINHIIKNCNSRFNSAKSLIKLDPKSALLLFLSSMEDVMIGIKFLASPFMDKVYSFSHETKLFAYYGYEPERPDQNTRVGNNQNEVYLFVDLSGRKTKAMNPQTESEFFDLENNDKWKNISQRYGAIFRAGRYFRSDEWTEFAKEENVQLQMIVQDLIWLLLLLFFRSNKTFSGTGLFSQRAFGTGGLEIFVSRNEIRKRVGLLFLSWKLINEKNVKKYVLDIGDFEIESGLIFKLNSFVTELLLDSIWRAKANDRKTLFARDV